VQFTLRIPFNVITIDQSVIKGYLPDIHKNVMLFMPDGRDELNFKIIVETTSKLLGNIIQLNDTLAFSVGVFSIIKVIASIQLVIPGYELSSEISLFQNLNNKPNHDIFYLKDFPNFFPLQNSLDINKNSIELHKSNQCPPIFGNLTIEKYITQGPIAVSNNTNATWGIELRVSNTEYGPVSNVIV